MRTCNISDISNIKKKITLNYSKSAAMGFFQGTQARIRNSRGKRATSVRSTESILYQNNKKMKKDHFLETLTVHFLRINKISFA